ncbi:ECF transporter S component [Convivina intestini]|uniref:ECF transporter S component n=1 Tax=Convivina intestini TaxID=1505726 RepID=UPI00200E651C|nr:ECF transporter S component [Convivina intestini]CAH1852338.1 Riboflavin transporter RibU [Convivina intestini]
MQHLRTKQITLISILATISFALMIFPQFSLIPGASFLKIEFSIIPVVIALYWLDFTSAVWVLVLRTILKVFLLNGGVNTYIGLPVNLAVALTFIIGLKLCLPEFDFGQQQGRKLLALIVSTLAMTAVALLVNVTIAMPLYSEFAHFDISKFIGTKTYLWGMVLPFNLIEGLFWSGVSYFVLILVAPFKNRFKS